MCAVLVNIHTCKTVHEPLSTHRYRIFLQCLSLFTLLFTTYRHNGVCLRTNVAKGGALVFLELSQSTVPGLSTRFCFFFSFWIFSKHHVCYVKSRQNKGVTRGWELGRIHGVINTVFFKRQTQRTETENGTPMWTAGIMFRQKSQHRVQCEEQ